MVIFLNLVLAGLRLGLKNYQVGKKWMLDDYLYLCKGLFILKNYCCTKALTELTHIAQ
ncbi:hypothetical protein THERMOS_590 [Bathymodiolus thermophilus thioautotrophic gill symbiont]|uniref:Uncharacterized protein n=1 Tax=Bathymodiolus thermophilus thioautotrophic gill symbiont TaxID=2360 RepID=A0A8H8XAX8_9GAMM|nr:hypothetical protein THERMOS_590 [Bathymodiolus thermophilus thioautotrophic gill symbiont]